jgi:RNA polymerase sigma factor (sigma-70 family)
MFTNDQEPTDNDLIDRIRAGGSKRDAAWQHITSAWGGAAMGVAMQRSGCNEWQAREAFSMATMGVDNRVRSTYGHDFLQKATLKTYLTQSTVYAAFAILRKQPKTEELTSAVHLASDDHEKRLRSAHCAEVMDRALDCLGARCKKLLNLFANGHSMEEIAKEMGLANADVAKREKYKCQKGFKAFLMENPAVKKQLSENCYG